MCSRKGKPATVPHFETDSFYIDLLQLPDIKKRNQRTKSDVLKRSNFREDDWPDDVSLFVPKRQKLEHEREEVPGQDESVAAEDPQPIVFEDDADMADNVGAAGDGEEDSAPSNDDIFMPTGDSDDSDDSTSSDDSSSHDIPEAASDAVADAVDDPGPVAAGPRRVPGAAPRSGSLFPKEHWHKWSYQPYMRSSGFGGAQMFCCNPAHNLPGQPQCAKQLADSRSGSAEDTLRILKQWAVLGVKDCASKAAHASLFPPLTLPCHQPCISFWQAFC